MKTSTHLIPGLISSLLLSVGFARAAAKFDPVASALGRHGRELGGNDPCSGPCVFPCQYYRPAENLG